jgi:hypothetical protein
MSRPLDLHARRLDPIDTVTPRTTRNYLICDEFFMTFSENVMDSLLWVPSPTMTLFQFRHSPAQNTVTLKQIRHKQQTRSLKPNFNILLSFIPLPILPYYAYVIG